MPTAPARALATLALGAAALAITLWPAPTQAQNQGQEARVVLFDYVVQEGDTCIRIARRVLGNRDAYHDIHKHNPEMGPTPHKLVPGTILKLPRASNVPDAHLTNKRGPVGVRQPAANLWERALRGMELFRQWQVRSQAHASAEVTFRDHSTIQMRENTVVIIYGPTERAAQRAPTTAVLERGTLRTRLAELDGDQALVVNTPSAESTLAEGSALISVDQAGRSQIANHVGKPVRVRSRQRGRARGRAVQVAEGMGSKVEPGRAPTPPRPLPATPTWLPGERLFSGDASRGGSIRGRWQPVANAVGYRIEIATDPEGKALVAQVEVGAPASAASPDGDANDGAAGADSTPGTPGSNGSPGADQALSSIDGFEAHRLPAGTYHVRVAARDREGFESKPSVPATMTIYALTVAELGAASASRMDAAPPASDVDRNVDRDVDRDVGPDIDHSAPIPPRVVIQGSVIVAPAGVRCRADASQEYAASVLLARPGAHQIECVAAQDQALTPISVQVDQLSVRADDGSGATPAPLPRGRDVPLQVAVRAATGDSASAGHTAWAEAVRVRGPAGVRLTQATTASPGVLALTVHADAEVASPIALEVVPAVPHPQADDVVLATVELALEAPVVVETVAPEPAPARSWHLDVFGGGSARDRAYALGQQGDAAGLISDSPTLGVRAGIDVLPDIQPMVQIEAELSAAPVTVEIDGDPRAMVFGIGGHARATFPGWGRFAPLAVVGGGLRALYSSSDAVANDAAGVIYYGIGGDYPLTDSLAMRLDGRHLITRADSAPAANVFEILLGLAWSPRPAGGTPP